MEILTCLSFDITYDLLSRLEWFAEPFTPKLPIEEIVLILEVLVIVEANTSNFFIWMWRELHEIEWVFITA